MGDEDSRMCSRLHGICRQTFGDHSKNKHKVEKNPTYTVEGTTTIRIKITFEESNFKLILTWQQCEESSEKIFGQRLLTAS